MENSFLYMIASVLFVVMAFVLLALIIYGLNYAYKKANLSTRGLYLTLFTLFVWLAFISSLSLSGFLQNFEAIPPRMFIALVFPAVAMIFFLRAPNTTVLVQQIPPQWFVYIQSFRILMEIILWLLFLGNVMPIQMSFEGLNFDILVGLTAPICAYLCFGKKPYYRIGLLWNIAGLLLLANIVTIAVLSMPTPLRGFMNEPANTFVASMPFTLLPAFVVPVAMYMHALSIKQLLVLSAKKGIPEVLI